MRLFAACLVAAGLLAHGAQAQQQCERILSIGAWNIEWLGKAGSSKQTPAGIAAYIAASKVEILGLEEISATDKTPSGARNKRLDDAFAILNKSGAQWQYELFPKNERARDPDHQWTGVAWDARTISKVGLTKRLDIKVDKAREDKLHKEIGGLEPDESVIFSRWPQVVKFSAGAGKTDIAVVVVHMKSNSGHDSEPTIRARAYEAELLVPALKAYASAEKELDVVVLGDANMKKASEPAGTVLTNAGYRDCNRMDKKTWAFKAPFDRIWVLPSQPETRNTCAGNGTGPQDFAVVPPSVVSMSQEQFEKRLSDHVMVKAGICVQKDDD